MSPLSHEAADTVLLVGQDAAGHWMVQENHGLMEGRFISREAALHYALLERHAFPGARIELSATPLRSTWEH